MGSYSRSISKQRTNTRVSTSNIQGNSAPVYERGTTNATAEGSTSTAIRQKRSTMGDFSHSLGNRAQLNQDDNSNNFIVNANGTDLARIAADVSLKALDKYESLSQQSLALAERAAVSSQDSYGQASQSVIDYKTQTEQPQGVGLSGDAVKWGAGLVVAYFVFKKVK